MPLSAGCKLYGGWRGVCKQATDRFNTDDTSDFWRTVTEWIGKRRVPDAGKMLFSQTVKA